MSKLYLDAVNAKHILVRHRSVYIITTMLFFLSIDRISSISRRNVVLELIANIFLVLNKDITKIQHTTSELCKHILSNIYQERR